MTIPTPKPKLISYKYGFRFIKKLSSVVDSIYTLLRFVFF